MNDDRDYYSGEYKPFSISGYTANAAVFDAVVYNYTGTTVEAEVYKSIYGRKHPHMMTDEEKSEQWREDFRNKYRNKVRRNNFFSKLFGR